MTTPYTYSNSSVSNELFKPILEFYPQSARQYDCPKLTDLGFLEMGVMRCLSDSQTGRDFLQRHADNGRKEVSVDHFFTSLKSERRLANVRSINHFLSAPVAKACPDPLKDISELSNFEIYAGDGHYHQAACHDKKQPTAKGTMRSVPVGHFFMLNMRTHYLRHLAFAHHENAPWRKGEHDMHALKRAEIDDLRDHAPKGRQVIIVWDKAGIDFRFWQNAKQRHGLYFISREKSNMELEVLGNKPIDSNDLRNCGVIADQLVGTASGTLLRRVIYVDPVSGEEYSFLTTEMNLPPGVIALLYKHRWDIEKVFDELKTKLVEKKAWASSPTGKTMQAVFLCITHNLMMLIEAKIAAHENLSDTAEPERRRKRKEILEKAGKANYVATAIQRLTQRTLKFIRWLRNFAYQDVSWHHAVARLTRIYQVFS